MIAPKKTLCLDFDGVLHSYASGWQGNENIPDAPTDGALEFVQAAQEHFDVVIFSTRCCTEEGRLAIKRWLGRWGFPALPVAKMKPPAFVTLDDRAITFDGTWPSIDDLLSFEPWYQQKKGGPSTSTEEEEDDAESEHADTT